MLETPPFYTATERRVPTAWALSADSAKHVYMLRHAQSFANSAAAVHGSAAYAMEALYDARLDDTGILQARILGERLRGMRFEVELVLVSPMTRALQTAAIVFPAEEEVQAGAAAAAAAAAGAAASAAGFSPSSAAAAAAAVAAAVAEAAAAVSLSYRRPRFVAEELLREAFGLHPCDARRSVEELQLEHAHVDFSGIGSNMDTWHGQWGGGGECRSAHATLAPS